MNNWKRIATAATAFGMALLLGACASTPEPEFDYKQDYDFTKVRNIGFYKHSGQVSGDNPMQLSDFQKESVKLPPGHPEGIFDAMGNIYKGMAKAVRNESKYQSGGGVSIVFESE